MWVNKYVSCRSRYPDGRKSEEGREPHPGGPCCSLHANCPGLMVFAMTWTRWAKSMGVHSDKQHILVHENRHPYIHIHIRRCDSRRTRKIWANAMNQPTCSNLLSLLFYNKRFVLIITYNFMYELKPFRFVLFSS